MHGVFLLRQMPDFERLKPHPANAGLSRRRSTSAGASRTASSAAPGATPSTLPFRQRLSIKVARGGRERYFIDGRSIAVDDDSFLILNDNRIYGSRFESNVDIESFSIFFRPGHGRGGIRCDR